MELQYKGANCLKLTTKNASLIIDDNLPAVGLKSATTKNDVALFTNPMLNAGNSIAELVIDSPGEYEVKGISIMGVESRANMDDADKTTNTIYRLDGAGLTVVVTGHIDPKLSESQLERIGLVDILVIPVGGFGYTLDAESAAQVIRAIEPKIIIPTHYADSDIKYDVNQGSVEDFLTLIGGAAETVDKLKLKAGTLPETPTVYLLSRS